MRAKKISVKNCFKNKRKIHNRSHSDCGFQSEISRGRN